MINDGCHHIEKKKIIKEKENIEIEIVGMMIINKKGTKKNIKIKMKMKKEIKVMIKIEKIIEMTEVIEVIIEKEKVVGTESKEDIVAIEEKEKRVGIEENIREKEKILDTILNIKIKMNYEI